MGQNFSPELAWPRTEIASYTRTIDFDAKASKEDIVQVQGGYPVRGGGRMPIVGERRRVSMVHGDYAWNLEGDDVIPAPAAADVRQLEIWQLKIWLTPHGFIKAAMATDRQLNPSEDGAFGTFAECIAVGEHWRKGIIGHE